MNGTRIRFTANDLANVGIPTVEHRLNDVRETLALVMMLARGCERADDLCMSPADSQAAWSRISMLTDTAMASLNAIERALPNPTIVSLRAPEVEGGAR